jgi:PKD repeat protein
MGIAHVETLHFGMRSHLLPLLILACYPLVPMAQTPYRIPVVVHIIHDDGPENISDAQVRNGIEILTRNWRKQNPDTVDIVEQFRPIAADMEVDFELARLDPDGNCTNGINRLRSALTTSGTHNVKQLIQWPRDRYLNIYVVRNAAGLAGHALMPFQADSIPEKDGIVIQGSYFGNIGTSNDLRSVVLSHELGHFLDLYHVWGGNNVPEFYYLPVGQQANCDIGDEVEDTPETIGWSTCNLNATSCDAQLDNVQNFMDYAYCARMFTQGQKARVHAALNSPVAQRNNLWTQQNLEMTGLLEPGGLCRADFRGRRNWCVAEEVELEDASYHDITGWSWDVGDGQVLTGATPTFSYTSPGVYDVSLTVSNASGFVNVTKARYLRVLEATGQPGPYVEGFEGLGSMAESSVFPECDGEPCATIATGIAASGDRSVRIPSSEGGPGLTYALTSPRLDISGISNPVLRFKYAFAKRDSANNDRIIVKLSRDCGKTWLVRRTIMPAEIATVVDPVPGTFVPGPGDWVHVPSITIPGSYATDNSLWRIELVSGGGNDLYIDDINLDHVGAIGIAELDSDRWMLAPNPAGDAFRIEGPAARQTVELFNLAGSLLRTHRDLPTGSSVPVNDLAEGTYLVRLSIPGVSVMRRLVVVR